MASLNPAKTKNTNKPPIKTAKIIDNFISKSKLTHNIRAGYKIDWDATQSAAEGLTGVPLPIGQVRFVNSQLKSDSDSMNN